MTPAPLVLAGRPRYYPEPVEWRALEVLGLVDGDTVDLLLARLLEVDLDVLELDDATRLVTRRTVEEEHATRVRLLWVDAPERRDRMAWAAARAAVAAWLDDVPAGELVVVAYAVDTFGRVLADVRRPDAGSLSEWLLRTGVVPAWVAS